MSTGETKIMTKSRLLNWHVNLATAWRLLAWSSAVVEGNNS